MKRRIRVTADEEFANGDEINFWVNTGLVTPPIVTLGDNNGFPHVRDVYARAREFNPLTKGVHVTIRFEGPARGREIAVNIYQPATQDLGAKAEPLPL